VRDHHTRALVAAADTLPPACPPLSTVGALLAQRLAWRFVEGDAYHPKANIDKMRNGRPLDDDDRRPWLQQLAAIIQHHLDRCTCLHNGHRGCAVQPAAAWPSA
jgi:gluconate kinase